VPTAEYTAGEIALVSSRYSMRLCLEPMTILGSPELNAGEMSIEASDGGGPTPARTNVRPPSALTASPDAVPFAKIRSSPAP
jgi:hypothetical protein